MEAHDIISRKSTVLFITILFLIVACSKDGNDPGNKYRVSEFKVYDNQEYIGHYVISYTGNKISLMQETNDGYLEADSSEVRISYPDGNTAELIYSDKLEGGWVQDHKEVLNYEGDKIILYTNYEFHSGAWEQDEKYEYKYTNENLVEEIDYRDDSGNWVPFYKMVCQYDGNNLTEASDYYFHEDWQIQYKAMMHYTGEMLDSVVRIRYTEGLSYNDSKETYFYDGNLIKTITYYNYEDASWVPDISDIFLYDTQGNLTSMTELDGSDESKIEYFYEEGEGNYNQLFYYEDFIWFYRFPLPTRTNPGDRDFILKGLHPDFH